MNTKAIQILEGAIARHERHMNGSEATSEQSQQQLMSEMQAALAALQNDDMMSDMSGGTDRAAMKSMSRAGMMR